MSRDIFALYQRHPWVLEVPISGLLMGPNRLAWLEAALKALSGTGIADRDMFSVVLLLDGHARGAAQVSVGVAQAELRVGLDAEQWSAAFIATFEKALSDDRFPTLAALVARGALGEPGDGGDDFAFGLERVLDGIEALVRR